MMIRQVTGTYTVLIVVMTVWLVTVGMLSPGPASAQEDAVLDWRADTLWTLSGGGGDGILLSRLTEHTLTPGPDSDVFLLDRLGHRVYRIDAAGHVVDSLFVEGSGPGELIRPVSITTDDEGNPAVFDRGKGVMVRRDFRSGAILPTLSVGPNFVLGKGIRWSGGSGVFMSLDRLEGGLSRYALYISEEGTSPRRLATAPAFRTVTVDYPRCNTSLTLTPHFTHRIPFAVGGSGKILAVPGPEYLIQVFNDDGEVLSTLRRPVEPLPVTDRLAQRELQGYEIAGCPIPFHEARDQGFADLFPTIKSISITQNDEVWVERFEFAGEPSRHDVFAPSGTYLGTVVGLPSIAVWAGDETYLTIIMDDLDVPSLQAIRVVRD
jgi:hypothetical protein